MRVTIDGGASSTVYRTVDLNLRALYANECRLGEDGSSWTGWEPYVTSRQYTFRDSQPGSKTVYYQCRNDFGSQTTYSTIYLQPNNPPSDMGILIDGGASYTTTPSVSLSLGAYNADTCRLMATGGSWSGWEPYTTAKSFSLLGSDGQKTVYYQCRNSAGSASAQSQIILDTQPPTRVTVRATARANSIRLTWNEATDAGTGVQGYRIYRSNTEFGLFALYDTTTETSYDDRGASPGATYAYTVRAFDGAGHEAANSNAATASITEEPQ
jgi:hypothetical protein